MTTVIAKTKPGALGVQRRALFKVGVNPRHSHQKRKDIQSGREENCHLHIIRYYVQKNLKSSPKTIRINEFSKVVEYKINTQKSIAFLYTNN